MIVRFSDLGELVVDLHRDPNAVARGVVRVTQKFRPMSNLGLTSVLAVATAKVLSTTDENDLPDYDLVRFERHVGDLWNTDNHDDEVLNRAAALVTEATAKLEECGFTVLAGEYALAEAH